MNPRSLDGRNYPNHSAFSNRDSSNPDQRDSNLQRKTPESPIDGLLLIDMSSRRAAKLLSKSGSRPGVFVSTKTRKGDDFFVTTYIGDEKKTTHKAYFRFEDGSSVTVKGKMPEWKNFQDFKRQVSSSNQERSRHERPASDSSAKKADDHAHGSSEGEHIILTMPDFITGPQPMAEQLPIVPADREAVLQDQAALIQLHLDKLDLTELHDKESMHFRDVTLKNHGFIGFSTKIPLTAHLSMDTTGQRCGIHHYGDPELRRLYYTKKQSDNSIVIENIVIDSAGNHIPIRDGHRCAPESLTAFLDKEWGRESHD